MSDEPSLRTLCDEDLDRVWTSAIDRGDEAFCSRCEVEFRRRTVAGSTSGMPSELVADLQKRLAERAGKPPSRPTAKVDYGNKSEAGERD